MIFRNISNNGFSSTMPQEILNRPYDEFKFYNYDDSTKQVPEKEESDKLIIDNDLNKDTLNKDTKSDKGGSNTLLAIVIVFGIIGIVSSILLFLVIKKNKKLKDNDKNNVRNSSLSTVNNVHINPSIISGNDENTTLDIVSTPVLSFNNNYNSTITEINTNNAITTIHDDDDDDDSIVINSTITTNNRYSVPLNSTNNINHVMTMNSIGEKGLLPSYEDVLNEDGKHNTEKYPLSDDKSKIQTIKNEKNKEPLHSSKKKY
ncbi:hypothetical protein BCR36DRAFT_464208 [Piromyces finnis]|uniref:Uncharacterized protein n=1 Tax=Piromyces finnis TaxID=1754191 RepID=A0A1Y1UL30_9FUNG|nr:hypothetical protein BCR36DRAFT_375611 [Piromyces finnis]ORX42295.1 hypothetical protein BCR36DRAFT_464208 [Piromyces finnis]|eukprot:ORX38768.1 hypothetical protein BCR36DRAFT_375611 [Piromyces finnis]